MPVEVLENYPLPWTVNAFIYLMIGKMEIPHYETVGKVIDDQINIR